MEHMGIHRHGDDRKCREVMHKSLGCKSIETEMLFGTFP
jgi:hypothetical protein